MQTEFGAEPRSALRQLFDVPDQVLLDVFRNVPALSDHPIYTEVLKNVYPSWRECIRKEASNMPKLVGRCRDEAFARLFSNEQVVSNEAQNQSDDEQNERTAAKLLIAVARGK